MPRPATCLDKPPGITLLIRMATISLKLSEEQTKKLLRSARAARQSKSAYIRSLIDGRIETAGDLLHAIERGEMPRLRRRRRVAA